MKQGLGTGGHCGGHCGMGKYENVMKGAGGKRAGAMTTGHLNC